MDSINRGIGSTFEDLRVHPSAVVGEGVSFGSDVIVGAGALLVGPANIGSGCRISAGCVLDPSDDALGGELVLEADVEVGAGAVISSAIRISKGARIQPGSVVFRDVPPHAIVSGNPAQIVGYTLSKPMVSSGSSDHDQETPGATDTGVRGVTLHHLPKILDLRGNLTVGEFSRSIPFEPKRYFMVFGVPNAEVRGEHAHRTCKQFLICSHGQCSVVADDGESRQEFLLDGPSIGLYLPALTWGVQYKYSKDAVLLVFASEFYDGNEYIRDYGEFRGLARRAGA